MHEQKHIFFFRLPDKRLPHAGKPANRRKTFGERENIRALGWLPSDEFGAQFS